jgi:hypothetical protein
MAPLRIVTSVYKDEHILNEWINNVNVPVIVYVKDDKLAKGLSEPVDDRFIKLCNYGRCDYAFIYHIVQNYDNLDDKIIFTKVNWSHTHLNLFKVVEMADKYDYLESGAFQILQYHDKDRWIRDGMPDQFNIHKIFDDPEAVLLYNEMLPNVKPPDVFMGWGHYPCFCVSKELIQRHPKSIYEALLKKFYPEDTTMSKERIANYNIEYNKNFKKTTDVNTHDGCALIIGCWLHDLFGRLYPLFFTHNAGSQFKCAQIGN